MTKAAQTITFADLSRFGLNQSRDVELYAKSPEGKATLSLIQKEIAALESIQDKARAQEKLIKLKRHRLIISLLLGFIEEKAHAKEHQKQTQQEMNRILDEALKKEKEEEEEEAIRESSERLEELLEIYNVAIESIEPELENKQADILETDKQLASLEEIFSTIEARYDMYNNILFDVDFKEAPQFNAQVKDIETQLSSYAQITSKLLNEGKDVEANQQQEQTIALRLKAEMLNQLQDAQTQEKHLFNRKAEAVKSLGEADFFIPKDKTLTLAAGQYYLHPRTKNWATLSQKELHDAQQAYRESTKNIMSMKMQLQLQRTQELSHNQQKQAALITKRELFKQEAQVLNKLLTKAQDTRLTLEQMLRPTPGVPQSNAMQQRQLIQQMSMAIRPNGNPIAIQQLVSPQNTGSTTPSTTPTPFSTTPKPGKYN